MPKLLQEAFAREHYLGLRVQWKTRFFELNSDGLRLSGKYLMSFVQRGLHLPATGLVYANVPPGHFPALETLQRGTRVDLYGEIRQIDSFLGVTLDLHRAELLPRTLWDRLVIRSERRY